MSTLSRILLIVVLGLMLAGGGLIAWYYVQQPQSGAIVSSETRSSGSALIGGPFTLTDQTGQRRSEPDLKGHYALVYFRYTSCPDICPTSLSTMTQGLDMLAAQAADKAQPVLPAFSTDDPDGEPVEAL